jgi:hypothetical protein
MEDRYEEPEYELAPDFLLINHYLAVVDPKNGETQEDRTLAARALIALYRIQRDQVNQGQPLHIDPRLLSFMQDQLRRCANQSDPLGAVEELLNSKKLTRGRRPTPHRDFVIAGDVAERVEGGATVDRACEDLVHATGLSFEQIRRIYFDQKKIHPRGLEIDLMRRRAERNPKE